MGSSLARKAIDPQALGRNVEGLKNLCEEVKMRERNGLSIEEIQETDPTRATYLEATERLVNNSLAEITRITHRYQTTGRYLNQTSPRPEIPFQEYRKRLQVAFGQEIWPKRQRRRARLIH